jgi:hypothetical protein
MLPSLYEIYIYVHPRTVSHLYAERPYLLDLNSGDAFMFDAAMIALGVGFFVAAVLYTAACNNL